MPLFFNISLIFHVAAETVTYNSLRRLITERKFAPVYLLHGEEGFYIDELTKVFEEIVPEDDRAFDRSILYAIENTPSRVIDFCRRCPMMGDRVVVIVKETQAAGCGGNWLNALAPYAENPSPSTILVICSRGASAKCKALTDAMKKGGGIVFESKKLNERSILPTIAEVAAERGLKIDPKAQEMLRDFVGTDLSRIYNQVGKLAMVLGPGATITPESIQRNIGISKDYNLFELIKALSLRDSAKAFTIADYFKRNPKENPYVLFAPQLSNYFGNLLVAVYTPDKSDRALVEALGLRSAWQLTDIRPGLRNYTAWQLIEIISEIRRFDAGSKGVGSRMDAYDLFHELIFKILNAKGRVTL